MTFFALGSLALLRSAAVAAPAAPPVVQAPTVPPVPGKPSLRERILRHLPGFRDDLPDAG
ncbi:MAG TPA: hypothetical protein PLI79_22170 [Mycobacterium sp.]|nr:hypothetical protein [Mycobacterium sp.]